MSAIVCCAQRYTTNKQSMGSRIRAGLMHGMERSQLRMPCIQWAQNIGTNSEQNLRYLLHCTDASQLLQELNLRWGWMRDCVRKNPLGICDCSAKLIRSSLSLCEMSEISKCVIPFRPLGERLLCRVSSVIGQLDAWPNAVSAKCKRNKLSAH